MLTRAMGSSANDNQKKSRDRSDQFRSLVGSLVPASSVSELSGAVRSEPIKLRHDLTCRVSFVRPRNGGQLILPFENCDERFPRPSDAALHRAHRTAADRRRILVGKAACPDQDQRLALLVGKTTEGARRVGKLRSPILVAAAAGNALGSLLVPGGLAPGPAPV